MRFSVRRLFMLIAVLLVLFALIRIGTSTYENLTRVP